MAKKVTHSPRPPCGAKLARGTKASRGAKESCFAKTGVEVLKDSDVRLLAREAALAALRRLADLSQSEDERIALAATQELLNRAFGKTAASASDEPASSRPLVIKIVRFGDVEGASEE